MYTSHVEQHEGEDQGEHPTVRRATYYDNKCKYDSDCHDGNKCTIEKCYYGNRLSYQGGRMSQDFTGGYGPEEFSLKKAKPGKYKVEANFYGHNQEIVAGATTLQMKLATHFGTPEVKEQSVTLRLKGRSEVVFVGEFEVK